MDETKERVIKIIRIIIALGLSLTAIFWINESHFGDPGKIWNVILFAIAWVVLGYDMVIGMVKSIVTREEILSENLLMVLASIGAFSLLAFGHNECFEAVLILLFFQIGEMFEDYARDKTKDAIEEAHELRTKIAHKKDGESVTDIDPKDIVKGDILCINAGEILPADGKIIAGEGRIDASSLTGESVPLHVTLGKEVAAGTILKDGYLEIASTSDYADNTVAKILELIEEGEKSKSKVTRFIQKFASIYTPIVFVVAILVAVIPPLFLGIQDGQVWSTWIYHGLCVLVISCPCSIVVSVPLSYFAGMGLASRKGILIKGAEVFDRLSDMGIVYTDKTGTITKGEFKIIEVRPSSISEKELLEIAKMCEAHSSHPIARAILAHDQEAYAVPTSYEEVAGKGVKAIYQDDVYLCGNLALLKEYGIEVKEEIKVGSAVYFAKNKTYLGVIVLGDEIKPQSSELVKYLRKNAIKIYLLSGDRSKNVASVAKTLDLDGFEGECTVGRKQRAIEDAKVANPGKVAFIGDGINDASALASSDLSIAMGGMGSDLAMEHADVVIMSDNPAALISAHKIARSVRRQSIFNIVFSITIKFAIIACSFFIPGFPLYCAVIADTGLLVVCILLSVSIFARKKL